MGKESNKMFFFVQWIWNGCVKIYIHFKIVKLYGAYKNSMFTYHHGLCCSLIIIIVKRKLYFYELVSVGDGGGQKCLQMLAIHTLIKSVMMMMMMMTMAALVDSVCVCVFDISMFIC